MTDWDEESVLSDSYLDHHSITINSSTTWGRPTVWISERESKPQTTECKDKDSHKSSEKIGIGKKKVTTDMFQNGLVGVLHNAETMKAIAPVMANMRDHVGRRVHLTAAKPSRDTKVPVQHATIKSRTLPRVDLCCLHPCSTQLLYRHCADCLLTSRNPALHTCPSIRVGTRFLPSTWGEVMPVPSHLQVHLSRQAPRPS